MSSTLRGLWLVSLLAAVPAAGQDPAERTAGDTLGWHTVVAGETLMGITQKYLGSSAGWRDNWRLNPDVSDPNRLSPGQKLRIVVKRKVRTAELAALSRKVEEKPYPEPWTSAELGDLLRERDGLRTHERSSALLKFEDQTQLFVTEQSVVFLRDTGGRLEAAPRRSLEIVEGQADLEAPAAAAGGEIEIVIGGAQAKARRSAETGNRSRSRRTATGTAQFMVYDGGAEVAAAGRSVSVDPGMGTTVPENGAPTPPEKLLPGPRLTEPAPGTILDHSNPVLTWDVVGDAARYVVEACGDPGCGRLLSRHVDVKGTRLQVEPLALGDVWLRVTAVSATGLDGFPGEPVAVSVRSLYRRPPFGTAPAPAAAPAGPAPLAGDAPPGARPVPTPPKWKPGAPGAPAATPTPPAAH
ncbi:MAG: LysM peptidoglycan-binding domain-containing protein [Vicinamibacteria bacterium]|nr:LysM peptidoglycan-binding domain-containing protein [Vicinamibacteria bacterium]